MNKMFQKAKTEKNKQIMERKWKQLGLVKSFAIHKKYDVMMQISCDRSSLNHNSYLLCLVVRW